jgi:hypothetical protein
MQPTQRGIITEYYTDSRTVFLLLVQRGKVDGIGTVCSVWHIDNNKVEQMKADQIWVRDLQASFCFDGRLQKCAS